MTEVGRKPYTEERTTKATAHFLADAEQQWREDAARHRLPLNAVHIELSRLYMDEATRRAILRAALQRLGQPVPDDLT